MNCPIPRKQRMFMCKRKLPCRSSLDPDTTLHEYPAEESCSGAETNTVRSLVQTVICSKYICCVCKTHMMSLQT